eukprot:sb/3477914/
MPHGSFQVFVSNMIGFFEVVTPLGGARVFICRVGIGFWLSRLCFLANLVKPNESNWGLSRANTTLRDKWGVTTSKNPTLLYNNRYLFHDSSLGFVICSRDNVTT